MLGLISWRCIAFSASAGLHYINNAFSCFQIFHFASRNFFVFSVLLSCSRIGPHCHLRRRFMCNVPLTKSSWWDGLIFQQISYSSRFYTEGDIFSFVLWVHCSVFSTDTACVLGSFWCSVSCALPYPHDERCSMQLSLPLHDFVAGTCRHCRQA